MASRNRVNKYAGTCAFCKGPVPAKGGRTWKFRGGWYVAHLACHADKAPRVITAVFSSGESIIQNSNGRCEDAPCCGCCSY